MVAEPLLLLKLIIYCFGVLFGILVHVDGAAGWTATVLRIMTDEDKPTRLLTTGLLLGCLHDRAVSTICIVCLSASFTFLEGTGRRDCDARGLAHAFLGVHELLLLRDLLYIWGHTEDTELGQLGRTQERLCLTWSVSDMWIRIDHLLIRHDILHDQILVLLTNGLVEFLFVLADQLLYIHVVLLLLHLLCLCTSLVVHDGLSGGTRLLLHRGC